MADYLKEQEGLELACGCVVDVKESYVLWVSYCEEAESWSIAANAGQRLTNHLKEVEER